jgi:hypothetical protein
LLAIIVLSTAPETVGVLVPLVGPVGGMMLIGLILWCRT